MIKIGIAGYGHLGRAAERAVDAAPDMTLCGIYSRRKLEHPKAFSMEALTAGGAPEVLLLCGGSATDLPEQGPALARLFHTVDCFDTHAKIPAYYDAMDCAARETGHLSLISSGWDPGIFSLQRLLTECTLPKGKTYTFWGRGVSQGHSDALRRVPGVEDAVQYTVPKQDAIERIQAGETPDLTSGEMHTRLCYVVPQDNVDREALRRQIVSMPHYFAGYETEVVFVTAEELARDHRGLPHGGRVIGTGRSPAGAVQRMAFLLDVESNPDYTAAAVCCARAVWRLAREGKTGAVTMFDIPPGYYSPESPEELRRRLL